MHEFPRFNSMNSKGNGIGGGKLVPPAIHCRVRLWPATKERFPTPALADWTDCFQSDSSPTNLGRPKGALSIEAACIGPARDPQYFLTFDNRNKNELRVFSNPSIITIRSLIITMVIVFRQCVSWIFSNQLVKAERVKFWSCFLFQLQAFRVWQVRFQ